MSRQPEPPEKELARKMPLGARPGDSPQPDANPRVPPPPDALDKALADTFPASDPVAAAPDPRDEDAEGEK